MRVPCSICGTEILEATAQRTGGLCMPCFKDPVAARKAQLPPPSLDECLVRLQDAIVNALMEGAGRALREHGEDLYGFYLYHHVFEYGVLSVLIESGFQTVRRRYEEKYGGYADGSPQALQMRWNACEVPTQESYPALTEPIGECFEQMYRYRETLLNSTVVEQIFINCVAHLRRYGPLPLEVLVSIQEGDESNETKVAYAELFNSGETLDRFVRDMGPLNEERLESARTHLRPLAPA